MSKKNMRELAQQLRDAYSPSEAKSAPEENGVRLATIPRYGGDEIRLNWASYEGRPFLNIRVWAENNGKWWPQKEKGLTVRVSELADFALGVEKALQCAVNAAHGPGEPQDAPTAPLPSKTPVRRSTAAKKAPDSAKMPFNDEIDDILVP